ncbi:LacI family DNA-binding transcriptional regulator [Bifidobacterium psychraerophilum]|jgi:DNA-binding LacI/PurR family transcriptional regulator|uniref:LacI family DNA-binding transcriptional regulator n=1 Tax=Bifidobacterium psychraerophilum TaxID=218140 RepID=UPI0023F27499|nr:LacI family DNA-binding transcriptional regulator [Bifidobacterium psychraerophilum]MCI1659878.1 LacI family transcriptional regulator [Bifidobacterium psychraerophilum]MCI1805219.1 LacI family transcriptional regulator [Bifidobacterium psychraerophilum]MCI2177285.1 LacI family transcriptional regulator [Bifidobacterium psychraerophilum]
MTRRVTIKDVAREAGVSIKTVSNVVNHTGSMRQQTRERVEKSMRELGYKVNVSARSLKTGVSNLIGLGIFDFSQPFAPYFADKVIEVARRNGYGVIISTYESEENGISRIITRNLQLPAAGWIYFNDQALDKEAEILEQPYPIVVAGDFLTYDKVDSVTMQNYEPIKLLTKRLHDSGCRSIAVLGSPVGNPDRSDFEAAREGTVWLRMKGYIDALDELGETLDCSMLIPCRKLRERDGIEALRSFLAVHECPDAIVCMNDALALAAIHELQRKGLQVPRDVQVTGFDNVPEAEYSTPALTTIDPDLDRYVEDVVGMLIERINGYDGKARRAVAECSIVERDSAQFVYRRSSSMGQNSVAGSSDAPTAAVPAVTR